MPFLNCQTVEAFENINAEKLEKVLENITLKKFARNKVSDISSIAANSFGLKICGDSFSLQFKLLFKQKNSLKVRYRMLKKKFNDILQKIDSSSQLFWV